MGEVKGMLGSKNGCNSCNSWNFSPIRKRKEQEVTRTESGEQKVPKESKNKG